MRSDPAVGDPVAATLAAARAVRVTLGEGVTDYALARGGAVYLSRRESRCCSGTLTFLDAATAPPVTHPPLCSWRVEGVDVHLVTPMLRFPREITIELRGRRRRSLVASLDGCAYRI